MRHERRQGLHEERRRAGSEKRPQERGVKRQEGLRKSERPALVAEAGRGGPSLQENTYHFLLNLSNRAAHGRYPRKAGLLAVLAALS
jgi:hypothetical protein